MVALQARVEVAAQVQVVRKALGERGPKAAKVVRAWVAMEVEKECQVSECKEELTVAEEAEVAVVVVVVEAGKTEGRLHQMRRRR
mmetsp:Transcript_36864/g.85018  ORF Transcript_36864/g.85018 Transcript_36864/m.85018 type:complete len:85 (+) Transcript_36864:485-739(+)